jgi:hypothetical protein
MLIRMASESLFDITDDELLISVYHKQARTLDDLPYTDEFERIYQAMVGDQTPDEPLAALTRENLFHRLHNLRKAGRLPRLGRADGKPRTINLQQQAALINLVQDRIEKLSLRDRLPYTDLFDEIVTVLNAQFGLNLSHHDVWRIIAKLAK